eukprot:scaffold505828_cov29-Prasinocladus_malaysianus.AAC.1
MSELGSLAIGLRGRGVYLLTIRFAAHQFIHEGHPSIYVSAREAYKLAMQHMYVSSDSVLSD